MSGRLKQQRGQYGPKISGRVVQRALNTKEYCNRMLIQFVNTLLLDVSASLI